MKDLTIIYYTCNYLDTENPVFLTNTKSQLIRAIGGLPLVVVSHKPMPRESFPGYSGEYTNIVAGKDYNLYTQGRHHLNIYKQILEGAMRAKTKYVAMAEDDILYSYEHFHYSVTPPDDTFYYDMNKLSLFTWTKPPVFSFRHNRMVVNNLISPRELLVEAMRERFYQLEKKLEGGESLEHAIKSWGDPGRYENLFGVTPRKTDTFMCTCPSIVFTHPKAYGYEFNHGKKKRLGDLRIIEVPYWGRAENVLKAYYEEWQP